MNKIMAYILPMKNFAAMIFAGFIILYMVTGVLFGAIYNTDFDYKIPFTFVLQGLVLALLISCLWSILFNNKRKSRTFIRLIIFAIILIGLVKISALALLTLSLQWVSLWIAVTAIIAVGLIVIAILGELFFRKEGKRYTEKLKEYQANL
ncbi:MULTISPECIES: hypothetical protein [Listeria]|uniref:hypothetical protein n=1 Tax=Listeria TaxID=1637 RepID=UPI000B592C8B|nr:MULTISPECIES: hypothetical protein [Listeria]